MLWIGSRTTEIQYKVCIASFAWVWLIALIVLGSLTGILPVMTEFGNIRNVKRKSPELMLFIFFIYVVLLWEIV